MIPQKYPTGSFVNRKHGNGWTGRLVVKGYEIGPRGPRYILEDAATGEPINSYEKNLRADVTPSDF